jgi:hypothetical protein
VVVTQNDAAVNDVAEEVPGPFTSEVGSETAAMPAIDADSIDTGAVDSGSPDSTGLD